MIDQPTTPDAHIADPVDYARPTMAQVRAALAALHQPKVQGRIRSAGRFTLRAGITKRHGQGTPKAKRKQAATSRRRNRKKRS